MENKIETKKEGRGGRRAGAGRKPISGVRRSSLTVSVTPELRAKVQARADAAGISISEYLNQLLSAL